MNVLSIGLDKGLFDKKSDVFWRHQDYSSWAGKYLVIIPTLKREEKKQFVDKNLEVVPTNSLIKFLYLFDVVVAAWRCRRYKFDLVTVQDPFLCGLAGVCIKYLLGLPLNVQIHSEFFNSRYFREESLFNQLCYFLGLTTLKFADTVRARNRKIKRDVINRYPRLEGKVAYVGVRLNSVYLKPISRRSRDRNLIVNVGRFAQQKNYPLLLRAFRQVRKSLPKAKLLLVGDERFARFKSPHVRALGPLSPNKLCLLYDKAGLFILSSNHEGWGLVVLEALARGCPVVMTDTGCAGEIVINGKTGYVAPIGNAKMLAQKIKDVFKNYDESLGMALHGRRLVEKDSNIGKIRQQMQSLYAITNSRFRRLFF